ncbi:G-protein coupled receptor Mth2-like [Sitodiplosis mosellana]|uniref:G-protein coupled receptor Mth2-like n=1 Tax=Sitodiplosis mosellana TaxID=263140 RepID=UPI002444ED9B|nr:G-protein coupled receptor Mth2-like [Sitodiplosis mosellana]XP_055326297.1 G-protein coupled receptor Mth2-like [Sitodiplosis mosellana]
MMWLTFGLFGLLFSSIITIVHGSPCDFVDSININDGELQSNNSIVFNGIEYPPNQYFSHTVNHTDGSEGVGLRGCICNIRKCIRLCCPHGSFTISMKKEEVKCEQNEKARNLQTEVRDENGQTKIQNLDQHFGYVDRICNWYYTPEPEDFVITHTGDVLAENQTYNHREYCIKVSSNETKGIYLEAKICLPNDEIKDPPPVPASFSYLPYVLFTSIPFLIVTFLVYICISELRNLHGKCFLCYLVCLMAMYILQALEQLNGTDYVDETMRKIRATLLYFATFSAFLWLNVISFDLWSSFRVEPNSERKRFILYSLYAFGGSLLVNIVGHVMDAIDGLPDYLQPGIGTDSLFLKENFTSRIIFYYGPLCIIVTVNLLFTILTAMKIFEIQWDLKKMTLQVKRNELEKGVKHQTDSYLLYIRLFIVTGVTWIAEAVWFLANNDLVFSAMDIINCAQGILIFVLFVLTPRVFRLIKKSWQTYLDRHSTDQSVRTNTNASTETTI